MNAFTMMNGFSALAMASAGGLFGYLVTQIVKRRRPDLRLVGSMLAVCVVGAYVLYDAEADEYWREGPGAPASMLRE